MNERATPSDPEPDTPSVGDGLFAHHRRRYLCYCLYLYSTPMKLLDVASQLAVWETGSDRNAPFRTRHDIYRSLNRDHLPALRDAGLVGYHRSDDMVTVGPAVERFERVVERRLPTEFDDLLHAEAETPDPGGRTDRSPERRDGTVPE